MTYQNTHLGWEPMLLATSFLWNKPPASLNPQTPFLHKPQEKTITQLVHVSASNDFLWEIEGILPVGLGLK